jgi:hypothetical protein
MLATMSVRVMLVDAKRDVHYDPAMQLPWDQVRRLTRPPAPAPAPVQPLLPLVEELVLLSLSSSQIRKHHVARLAADAHPDGPSDYHASVASLVERGMRIASIGQGAAVPAAVRALADELGAATMQELADRLLPPGREDLRDADFAGRSNVSAALTYGPGAWC